MKRDSMKREPIIEKNDSFILSQNVLLLTVSICKALNRRLPSLIRNTVNIYLFRSFKVITALFACINASKDNSIASM